MSLKKDDVVYCRLSDVCTFRRTRYCPSRDWRLVSMWIQLAKSNMSNSTSRLSEGWNSVHSASSSSGVQNLCEVPWLAVKFTRL